MEKNQELIPHIHYFVENGNDKIPTGSSIYLVPPHPLCNKFNLYLARDGETFDKSLQFDDLSHFNEDISDTNCNFVYDTVYALKQIMELKNKIDTIFSAYDLEKLTNNSFVNKSGKTSNTPTKVNTNVNGLGLNDDMPIGKYRGMCIQEIISIDAQYIVWACKNMENISFEESVFSYAIEIEKTQPKKPYNNDKKPYNYKTTETRPNTSVPVYDNLEDDLPF